MSEIAKGYKKTEIGVIPEDWEVRKLEEVCKERMQNGVFYKPSKKGRGIKLINVGDLYKDAPIDLKKLELFNANPNEEKTFKVLNGDLFFTRSSVVPSGIAQCNIYYNDSSEKVVFDSHVIRVRPNEKQINSFYFYRYCVSQVARNYLISHAKSAIMTTIDQGVLKKCPIVVPSLPEQTAIAEALSDTDSLISSLEKLIDKKRKIKEGAMQELLTGKKRLAGFSGEWEVKRLGEICIYQNGTSLEKYFNNSKGLKVISIGNYSSEGKFIETNTYIDWNEEKNIKNYILNKNDLTMILNDKTSIGTIIGKVLLIQEENKYVFNQRTMRLTPKDYINPFFIYYKINSNEIHNKIILASKPGTQIYVNTNDIIDLEITLPPTKEEQTAIAEILSDMDREISSLETKLEKYKQIKQGMMQELLTGRIRLI